MMLRMPAFGAIEIGVMRNTPVMYGVMHGAVGKIAERHADCETCCRAETEGPPRRQKHAYGHEREAQPDRRIDQILRSVVMPVVHVAHIDDMMQDEAVDDVLDQRPRGGADHGRCEP